MKRCWWIVLLLAVAVAAVFGQVATHEYVHWDDDKNVYHNPYFQPVTPARVLALWQQPYQQLYVPLTYTAWALVAARARRIPTVEGTIADPAPFHALNVLLHLGSALVVFALLRLLVRNDRAAGIGAALFALHPLQVEPVSWITGLKDVLGGLLSLVALWQYTCFAGSQVVRYSGVREATGLPVPQPSTLNPQPAPHPHTRTLIHPYTSYSLATLAYVLALLAKPSAVSLALAAGVLDWWAVGRPFRCIARSLAPWLAIAGVLVLVTRWAQPESSVLVASPLWLRPFVAGDALAFYLGKLVLPLSLAPDYGRSPEWVARHGWGLATWLVPVGLALAAWRQRKRHPWALAALLLFVAPVLPVLGLVPFAFQAYSTVADRYVYVALLGPSLAIAWLCARAQRPQVMRASVLGLVLLGTASAFQTLHWNSSITLFERVLQVNPRSWVAHNNLGVALARNQHFPQAIAHYHAALRLMPGNDTTHNDLGVALALSGDRPGGIREFRKAIRLAPRNQTTHYNLAQALELEGRTAEAIAEYREAIRLDPRYADAHARLALAEKSRMNRRGRGERRGGEAEAL